MGSYTLPLGSLGRFADSLGGHPVVLVSLDAFLTATASRLAALAAGN